MRFRVLAPLILSCAALPALAVAEVSSLSSEVEQAIIQQTNDFRKENDLPSLEAQEQLNETAAKFAKYMAETQKYGHHADGRTPAQRVKAAGYEYCVVRENIAYRTNTGEVTASGLTEVFVDGWIDSPQHRENLLATYATQTGVAVATTDGVTYFAVQLFGRPKSAALKLQIHNESGQARVLVMEANDSVDEFEMPPRTTLTMTRCYPTTLSLEGDEVELKVTESAELTITADGIKRR